MTILVALAIRDGVLMMADGRRANRLAVITDSARKLTCLRTNLTLAVAGAQIGTDMAEAALRDSAATALEPLRLQLEQLARTCALQVMNLITPETRHQSHVKVALLAGGLDEDGPFLAAGLFGDGMDAVDSKALRPDSNAIWPLVIGGESAGASTEFEQRVVEVLRRHVDQSAQNSVLRSELIAAGAEVIRNAADLDNTIGGEIQYCFMRRNCNDTGFL